MISLLARIVRTRRTILAAAAVAAALVLIPGAAASADTGLPVTASSAAAAGAHTAWTIPDIGSGDTAAQDEAARNAVANSPTRTLNRWGESSASFHTKFDGFIGTQLQEIGTRGIYQGGAMTAGNIAYKITSEMTQFAVGLNIIDGMGNAIDGVVQVMLKALIGVTGATGGGILFATLALFVVILAIWRNARMGIARMAREVGALILIIAIVFGVGATALNHKPGTGNTYNPAPATPGWFIKGINDGITNLAAAPAKVFVDGVEGAVWGEEIEGGLDGTGALGGGLGCSAYSKALKTSFANSVTTSTPSSSSLVAIASVTDSLWDSTGLYAWAKTQLGYNNPFAAKVYCRLLDLKTASVAGGGAAYVTWIASANTYGAKSALNKAIVTDASVRAPFAQSSVEHMTASMVAWAACKPTKFSNGRFTWAWEKEWTKFNGGHEELPANPRGWTLGDYDANEACQKWWVGTTAAGDTDSDAGTRITGVPKMFYVKGDAGWISDRTQAADPAVRDYLTALTGINPWGGTMGVFSYAAGAGLTMVAFGFIDIVVIVAKLFAAMFILSMWFVLVGAMFRPAAMKDRLVKTANKFLGTVVFAAMTTLILTFVVVFTRALIRMGIDMWGAGTVGSMIWAGLAPVLALVLVHILFVKVFKLPSPVSLQGAQAWGKSGMSGAIGAGVGAGVGSYLGSRMGDMAKGAARSAGGNLLNKVSGGRLGTTTGGARSSMTPVGKNGTVNEELAARVDAGEELTKKEQKLWDKQTSAEQAKVDARNAQIAQEKAVEQRGIDKADLRSARREFREEFGVAAPGDLLGATVLGAAGAASAVKRKAAASASRLADRVGLSALTGELATRRATRAAAVAARQMDAAARREARAGITGAAAASVATVGAQTAQLMDGATGAAKRAAWGAPALVGGTAALTANVAGARAMGAAAQLEVVPQVDVTPVVDQADVIVGPSRTGGPAVQVAGARVQVNAPAGAIAGNVRAAGAPQARVGAAKVNVNPATIRNAPPVIVPGPQAGSAVRAAAAVVSAPANAAHAARKAAWKVEDGARAKGADIVNSRKIVAARADAAIVRGAVQNGLDSVRQSDVYKDAEKVAQRTAKVIAKGTHAAATGAAAVGHRKQNNAAVLGAYRARKDAQAAAVHAAQQTAQRAAAAAARMSGGGNTPGGPAAEPKDNG